MIVGTQCRLRDKPMVYFFQLPHAIHSLFEMPALQFVNCILAYRNYFGMHLWLLPRKYRLGFLEYIHTHVLRCAIGQSCVF